MLKNAGFQVPEINMKAYMKARSMTQEFIDDFWDILLILPTNICLPCCWVVDFRWHDGINDGRFERGTFRHQSDSERTGKEPMSLDDLVVMLFEESGIRMAEIGISTFK